MVRAESSDQTSMINRTRIKSNPLAISKANSIGSHLGLNMMDTLPRPAGDNTKVTLGLPHGSISSSKAHSREALDRK